ncbi:MAG: hypothetical protein R3304_06050 [Longimicrobiales bacterium]|nr:hypothetical protein [Longimicrobiales bacterium]
MLDSEQLVELYRRHRKDSVLSIYLDADQHDFAERGKWRIALKSAVADERAKAHDDERFDQALEHLQHTLDENDGGFLSGRGWVGFATADGLLHSESLPVPMPNLVRWEDGLRVAPYARALKQSRPVVAVVIDSRRARLLRYKVGLLAQRDVLEADTYLGDLTDVHVAKVASTHSGIRGKTGTDAAQNFLDIERDRLVVRVAEEVRKEVGADGLLVVGGAERTVDALKKELGDFAADRREILPSLNFDMSDSDLRKKVEDTASEISQRLQGEILGRVVDEARSEGAGCLGEEDTERALLEGRVDTLLISDSFRERSPDRADHFEGAAFEHGAKVIEVARDAGERLQEAGGGVGALLRYRIRS